MIFPSDRLRVPRILFAVFALKMCRLRRPGFCAIAEKNIRAIGALLQVFRFVENAAPIKIIEYPEDKDKRYR